MGYQGFTKGDGGGESVRLDFFNAPYATSNRLEMVALCGVRASGHSSNVREKEKEKRKCCEHVCVSALHSFA